MTSAMINFGIHLGGDYCVLARRDGERVEVINTPEGAMLTPTAIWLDRKNVLQAGKPAAAQFDRDTDNTAVGYVHKLGSSCLFSFKRDGRTLSAEELTAEQLKALLQNARAQTGQEIQAAAVSIPAFFDRAQAEAVERAARQAGLLQVRLISELCAAVYAHAFFGQVEQGFWLVFCLGPYSFETAVIHQDGPSLEVRSYLSDRQLGDKFTTQSIVDNLLAPAAARDYQLTEFQRSNLRWRKAFAKLDVAVETARNKLVDRDRYTLSFDILCSDDAGAPVPFEYDLKDKQVASVAGPILKQCIALSLQALAQANVSKQAINSAIPMGEATLSPLADEYVNHPRWGLGIPLNLSVDPLTVAAQGAAIFAGTQPVDLSAPVVEVEAEDRSPSEAPAAQEAPAPEFPATIPAPEPAIATVSAIEAPCVTSTGLQAEENSPLSSPNLEDVAAWLLDAQANLSRVLGSGRAHGNAALEKRLANMAVEIDLALQEAKTSSARSE